MKLLSALALLCLPLFADADCRHRVVVKQVAVVEPVFVAVAPVAYPSYSVSYNPLGASSNDIAALITAIQGLKAEIQSLKQPQQQAGSKGLQILGTRCASCHDVETAKAKGGGMMLFSGKSLVQLSAVDTVKVLRQIRTNKMPKSGPKLTDEEYAEVSEYLESVALQPATKEK